MKHKNHSSGSKNKEQEKASQAMLEKLKRDRPFSVPENYFDLLTSEIRGKVEKNSMKESRPGFFPSLRWHSKFALAVLFMVICVTTILILQQGDKEKDPLVFELVLEDITDEDLILYLVDEEYPEYLVYDL